MYRPADPVTLVTLPPGLGPRPGGLATQEPSDMLAQEIPISKTSGSHDGPRLPPRIGVPCAMPSTTYSSTAATRGPVGPCPPQVTVDAIDGDRCAGKPVDADPLLDDFGPVDGSTVLSSVPCQTEIRGHLSL